MEPDDSLGAQTRAPGVVMVADATPCTRGPGFFRGFAVGTLLASVLVVSAPAVRDLALQISIKTASYNRAQEDARVIGPRVARLQRRLAALTPNGAYLVVSTTENRFQLRRGGDVVREGLCSTGSYVRLEGEGDQRWTFKTPHGVFRIQRKVTRPVWTKPDWAFVEEGLPVPPPGSRDRVERGVLGDFALALGDGYLIHGTLYQRLLGMPVTHGCVRLGDDDLRAVYVALGLGAPVFIY
jgi:L,D-transpeptidase ErfK/SrfK